MRRRLGIVVCALLLLCTGCSREDSGAYDKGMEALALADYDTAMENFQKAANEDDRKAEAYRGEGIIYLRRQDYEHAITLFSLSLQEMKHKNQEFREDVLFYQAEAYQGNGQEQEALDIYESLIKGSQPAQAYFVRGNLYLQKGDLDQAEADFRMAVNKSGEYEIYIQIYEAYAAVNREADGALYLEEALQKEATDADQYYQEGRIYTYLEEYDKAKTSLNQAVSAGKEEAIFLLGQVCLKTGGVSEARALYQSCLDQELQPAAAYNGLALCEMAEKNYDSALAYIQQGLDCQDSQEEETLLFNEIVIYEYRLDFETAKAKMTDFLAKYPNNQTAIRENTFLQSR